MGSQPDSHSDDRGEVVCVAGVLIGGRSLRMGRPKALLPHAEGGTMVEHAVRVARRVAVEVFLLGMLAPRVGENAAMAGMLAGFLTMIYVKFGTPIAWTWYVVIGTLVTFLIGYIFSFLLKEKPNG